VLHQVINERLEIVRLAPAPQVGYDGDEVARRGGPRPRHVEIPLAVRTAAAIEKDERRARMAGRTWPLIDLHLERHRAGAAELHVGFDADVW